MEKRVYFLIIVVLIFSISLIRAENSSKVDKVVLDKLNIEGKIKIIAKIGTNARGMAINSQSTASSIPNLENVSYKLIGNGNYISAEVNMDELDNLISSHDIISISEDAPIRAFLQNSVPLINATSAWKKTLNSINMTGKGQTICIIDTGIDYAHSDLGGCFGSNNPNSNCRVLGGYDFSNNDGDPKDDNGHGTHVAGIAAASGGINGVAPEAKLIAIKALDSHGSGVMSDLINGIEWCVGNSSVFNISVISMSLGTDTLYPGFCDNADAGEQALAAAINEAVGKNISVVAATGNSGNTAEISSPACITNSTRVGATDKSDAVESYSNRNSLVKLMAPGTSINSTWLNGGYAQDTGTSMSVPHVSGAIAILNEYIKLTGSSKTPQQIENTLNSTGKQVSDGSRTFSRIDVYNALISLDNSVPVVGLEYPSNDSTTASHSISFGCNATDLSLKNATFYLWNSTSIFNQTITSSNLDNIEINASGIPNGDYLWNCLYFDENNNRAFSASNYTLNVNDLNVTLISPENGISDRKNQTFICNSSSSAPLANMTFYLWNSTGIENTSFRQVSGNYNLTNFSYNFTHEDNYLWSCLANNNLSRSKFSDINFSIKYDLTPPAATINFPQNESWYNKGIFNLTLNEAGNCIYSLDDTSNKSMTNLNGSSLYDINITITDGEHNVKFYCNDSAGNLNSSLEKIYFNVETTPPEVNSVSPEEGYIVTGSQTMLFNYNASDDRNVSQCSLIIGGNAVESENQTFTNFSYLTPTGSHQWFISCMDEAGNIENSTPRSLTVNTAVTASGSLGGSSTRGGSSGGGGGATIQNISNITAEGSPQNNASANNSNKENKKENINNKNSNMITYILGAIGALIIIAEIFYSKSWKKKKRH